MAIALKKTTTRFLMKVAYVFSSQGHTVSYKLGKMILPQLEDNNYVLVKGDPLGERLLSQPV
jgi:hypothetical protein